MRYKVISRIFASLQPGIIHIHVGHGSGMLDGGFIHPVNRNMVPPDCRLPNTYVWVIQEDGNIIAVEKMSLQEMEQYKIVSNH